MTEPVILRNSFAVAVVSMLQVIVPGVAVAALLYVVVFAFGDTADTKAHALALFAALLTLMLRRPRSATPPLLSDQWSRAADVVLRWGLVLAILLAIGYTAKVTEEYSRRVIITWALVATPLLLAVNLSLDTTVRKLLTDPLNARRTVFVGVNDASCALARELGNRQEFCMAVAGFFDDRSGDRLNMDAAGTRLLGKLKDLAAYVKDHSVHVIFIALPLRHLQRVRDLLDDLRDTTASIYYVPDVFVFDLIQARSGEIFGIPVVALCETPFYGSRGVSKRIADIVISTLLLLVAAPFLLLLAVLVKCSSRGPVIFRQVRYGLDGQRIVVYKYRTMTVMEDGTQVVQATREDSRITPIGRFLRRYSLDELPQFVNVLQGRMSVVGPRPHAVAHNETYRKLIKGYMVRHKVLPGITGLAQINGCRGETSQLEEMRARIEYDLDYLRHWSLWLDLKIMFLTVWRLLGDERAY